MKKVHIISHTHWDREWYRPFEFFRSKLYFVMENLLKILENDASFKHFLLDGQTIPLEDYLEIKPGSAEKLRNFIRSRRIIVGPWYIQPDEFTPDGESLIRNLQLGMKTANKFGEPMLVGYLPDSFGHSGQMPHILKGFGIDSAVVMRGVPAHQIQSSEFIWEAVNGDQVFSIYLPHGYSNALFMPENFGKFKLRLTFAIQQLKKWVSTENYLVMNGVDHQFPQPQISKFITRLNKTHKRDRYVHSTLENYIHDVKQSGKDFQHFQGELICPAAHRVHTSIASTRIYQKQKNRKMEALLENYVEPVATIAWMYHADYPQGLVEQAWKYLLQNQTHDGICGCCTDEVHKEIDQRFTNIRIIGETLTENYARAIAKRISPDQLTLTIFNNAMVKGVQLIHAAVYVKTDKFTLQDLDGKLIPYQVEKIEEVDVSQMDIWTLYVGSRQMMKKIDICFTLNFESNLGCKILRIIEKGNHPDTHHNFIMEGNRIENRFFKIEIYENGSLGLFDKETAHEFKGLHLFEDCGDAGDTYNYSPVERDAIITSENASASFEIEHCGYHQATIKIRFNLLIPESLAQDDCSRSTKTVILPITSRMTIYSEIKRIDFQTEINNTVRDHRLRVLFPAGIRSDVSYAETQFGIVARKNKIEATADWKRKGWKEKPLPIYSQQKFVDLSDGNKGLAVLNRGLPEYEIYDDSIIAVTLIRSVGFMGKENLLIRPGRFSGMPIPTPDAQCQGKQVFEYALLPHSGCVYTSRVPGASTVFNSPAYAIQNTIHRMRPLSREKIFNSMSAMETMTSHIRQQLDKLALSDLNLLTVNNETLIISAVKKAEEGNALIVRIYNPSAEPVRDADLQFGVDIRGGYLTDFNEKEKERLAQIANRSFLLPEVKPQSALTVKFLI